MRAKWSRIFEGGSAGRRCVALIAAIAIGAVVESAAGQPPMYQRSSTYQQPSTYQQSPIYQRKSFAAGGGAFRGGHGFDRGRSHGGPMQAGQQVQSGWFQRPYPYHLDYYRMRYGGSYAPYFGNLYGPPNVVLAAPYYGGYGNGGYGAYPGIDGFPPQGPMQGEYQGPPGGSPLDYPAGPTTDNGPAANNNAEPQSTP